MKNIGKDNYKREEYALPNCAMSEETVRYWWNRGVKRSQQIISNIKQLKQENYFVNGDNAATAYNFWWKIRTMNFDDAYKMAKTETLFERTRPTNVQNIELETIMSSCRIYYPWYYFLDGLKQSFQAFYFSDEDMDDTKIEHYEPVDMRDTYYDIEVEYHSIKASHLHNQEETEQLKESLITLYENGVFKNPFV